VKSPPLQREIEKVIRDEAPDLLRNLPGEKKAKLIQFLETRIEPSSSGRVISTHHQTMQVTASPIPPAELLVGYNAAFPNGADRLFQLVEKQSQFRQDLEDKVVTRQLDQSRLGQWLAFWIALTFGVMACVLTLCGYPAVGGTIFVSTVCGLAGTFLAGRASQQR
jgi:uncharacterized membrane protein